MYLCALGQYDYDAVPAIPPEIVLFPNWFYFNIYEISSWSRSILVPLAIMYAKKPFKKIPPEQGIDELFVGGRANSILRLRRDRKRILSWRNFFIVLDRLMHWAEAVHLRPRAHAGAAQGGEMAAGAAGDDRRPGRHLSGHAERHHRAALPGLLRGRSAGDSRPRRV